MKDFPLLIICLILFGLSSCDSSSPADLCDGIDCGQFGTCVDGECECEAGYFIDPTSGICISPCDTIEPCPENSTCFPSIASCRCNLCFDEDEFGNCVTWKEKFLGTWHGYHIEQTGPLTVDTSDMYIISISVAFADTNRLVISNFMNLTCSSTGQPVSVESFCRERNMEGFYTNCNEWMPSDPGNLVEFGQIIPNTDTLEIATQINGPTSNNPYHGYYTRQ